MATPPKPTPLGLTVLNLLRAGPMHPYAMQRLIKLWGKDKVVNVGQRANLYKTIRRLLDEGLVSVRQTERDQLYPERTVYELTEEGRRVGAQWLEDMIAAPHNEFPVFPAALSFGMVLGPEGLRLALARRAMAVGHQIAELKAELTGTPELHRVTLLETEYQLAVAEAEDKWLATVLHDLGTGALTWSEDTLLDQALP